MLIILAVVGLAIAGSILLLAREVRRRMGDIQEVRALAAKLKANTDALAAKVAPPPEPPVEPIP